MMRSGDVIGKILFLCASFSAVVVFLITFFLLREGIRVLNWGFITGMTWSPHRDLFGILPTLVGTVYVVAGAVVIATAIGVPTAIYLAEFAPFWLRNIVKSTVEVIVGIPSVVIGFFGLMVLVPFIRNNIGGRGESILAGWIVLAFMILPNLITIAEDSLRAVPRAYREASLALGATRWQTVRNVVLPTAASGIRTALVLGVGRAMGETMAVLMVVGNPETPWIPTGVLDRVRMLTSTIAIEYSYAEWGSSHQYALFAIGVVLFFMVTALNFIATFVIRRRNIQ
ncbi:phosphate ABC transporter permease subunit PstC [Candidatus Bathyarchaeota archaeon]|nr:phosphate ABC transporter permease subunit PstC [Candidatus Bathyarchaeota archaeon]